MTETQAYIIIAALFFIAAGLHKESDATWKCFYAIAMLHLLLSCLVKVMEIFYK